MSCIPLSPPPARNSSAQAANSRATSPSAATAGQKAAIRG
eukprot:CAMPEP_0115669742 /NCGR_PEP_ID=MMETSP0272-20121206/51162_1 /TAXON_ID=71861 /ORGANISM="Scrippsiella trochoidea, Strain CCMP3099" /LENGTH=39 /DNA_ID= /DNA_START= /DNA_END= /DNA_ORIENTATION=